MEPQTFQFTFCLFPKKPDEPQFTADVTVLQDKCRVQYHNSRDDSIGIQPVETTEIDNEQISSVVSTHVDIYSTNQDFSSFVLL